MSDKMYCLIAIGLMITILEVTALLTGHNGTMFYSSICGLGGLFGYAFGRREKIKCQ